MDILRQHTKFFSNLSSFGEAGKTILTNLKDCVTGTLMQMMLLKTSTPGIITDNSNLGHLQ